MEEVYRILEGFFNAAPWPTAAIAVTFMICKFKPFQKSTPEKNGYVLKEECHGHIDGMKEDMSTHFGEINAELREIRSMLFTAIQKGSQ